MIDAHPLLLRTAAAARHAYQRAGVDHGRDALAKSVMIGADGTATMRIDQLVEDAVVAAVGGDANVLSEECGWIDHGSAVTIVVDPVDGSANAAAGVPLSCFSAALAVDGHFTEALTCWLHTDDRWWAGAGGTTLRTSGRTRVAGAAISLLRPRASNIAAWWRVAERAARIRVLGCSTLDAAFVASGSVDAFADAGSDTHRLVDLAAACVLVPAAGGVVVDAFGRAIELDLDLTRRWSGVVAATPELADELLTLVACNDHESVPAAVPASSR